MQLLTLKENKGVIQAPGFSVLSGEQLTTQINKQGHAPESVSAIMCTRDSIVPVPNNKQVLISGYPLYIAVKEGNENRMVILEFTKKDRYRVRAIKGKLTDTELEKVAQVLKIYDGASE